MPIIRQIRQSAVQAGTGAVLKKVSGVLRDQFGSPKGNAPGVSASNQSSASFAKPTNIFSFPLDVTGGPGLGNQGHYVMFFINEQQSAEVRFGNRVDKSVQDDIDRLKSEANIPAYIRRIVGDDYVNSSSRTEAREQLNLDTKIERFDEEGNLKSSEDVTQEYKGGGQAIYIERAPTVRLDTAIALYMPPTATFTDNSNYTDTEIGAAAKLGIDTYNNITGGASAKSAATDFLDDFGTMASEGLVKALQGAVGALPGFSGIKEASEMASGQIVADRMELAFKGVAKRKFQFTFKMIPKNRREADEIRNIIFAFRANMLPEFVGGNRAGRKMRVPNTFDIQYMYNGQENQYLQKISTCVLENITVAYGGDRFRTFTPNDEGAPPVETSITLNFSELEVITKERVFEGY